MIKIILIDNDERNYLALKKIICKLDFLYSKDLVINWYKICNQELEKIINDNEYKKIYLINVCFNIASLIRNKDHRSELILLGKNYNKWVKNIFDFIPNIYEHSKKTLLDIKEILDNYYIGNMFIYQNSKYCLRIYYDNILYIYRDTSERKVVIITDKNDYHLRASLNDIEKLLDNRFKQVHRSCFINMCRTQKFNWVENYFILDNGKKIDLLSKKFCDKIKFK